jgi:hypothetical protein
MPAGWVTVVRRREGSVAREGWSGQTNRRTHATAAHRDARSRDVYLPNTVFSRSVVRAAGLVRIFFSSSPTMWNSPSSDLFVT